jgi:enoyl-[acyl-carrier protein] reductase II
MKNRITELLGVEYPIVQAPMGWIARARLASAVSEAGGLGIIETSSGELDAVREEVRKMRKLTAKPFGVNIAQAFVRDPDIVQFVVDQGVQFVTAVKPVAQVIRETMDEFDAGVAEMAAKYGALGEPA